MFLALDIGNSCISGALSFRPESEERGEIFSIPSTLKDCSALADQVLKRLFAAGFDSKTPLAVGAASVVPALSKPVDELLRKTFVCSPHWISHQDDFAMPIAIENPQQIGADRLVNAAYAKQRYGAPVIVVDLGTATSFDVVSGGGHFIGGVIAPGLELSVAALCDRAAQLPEFKLTAPRRAIGRDTMEALESGSVLFHAGGIDKLISLIQSELEETALVVATGGLLTYVKPHSTAIDIIAPDLTLQGVRWITERNSPENRQA